MATAYSVFSLTSLTFALTLFSSCGGDSKAVTKSHSPATAEERCSAEKYITETLSALNATEISMDSAIMTLIQTPNTNWTETLKIYSENTISKGVVKEISYDLVQGATLIASIPPVAAVETSGSIECAYSSSLLNEKTVPAPAQFRVNVGEVSNLEKETIAPGKIVEFTAGSSLVELGQEKSLKKSARAYAMPAEYMKIRVDELKEKKTNPALFIAKLNAQISEAKKINSQNDMKFYSALVNGKLNILKVSKIRKHSDFKLDNGVYDSVHRELVMTTAL